MSYDNVGKKWKIEEFKEYLKTLEKPQHVKKIVVHHTGMPTLSLRENGLTSQHIINIREFYKTKKWKSGPHLFVDDFYISGMTPLNEKGTHAVSFNSISIGIEVLGNYDFESPFTGRGKKCWENTASVLLDLFQWLEIEPNLSNLLFHRDDKKTNKSCPGNLIKKEWVLELIENERVKRLPPPPKKEIKNQKENIEKEDSSFWKRFLRLFKK